MKKLGELLDTFSVKTGNGVHYFFKYPPGTDSNNTQNLGFDGGIDLWGNGGYVVAPPSLHPDGHEYEIIHDFPYK